MTWPFRKDVAVSFGFGHSHQRLRFDGLGRPFVMTLGGEVNILLPGGVTQTGRRWIPLSKRAAVFWPSPPSDRNADRDGSPLATKTGST